VKTILTVGKASVQRNHRAECTSDAGLVEPDALRSETGPGVFTCGEPSEPGSLVFLASLFFFLCSGLDSRIISSSSNVGSQFSLRLCGRKVRLTVRMVESVCLTD